MTIISGPVKSVAYHPDVSQATAAYSAAVIDVFEARRRLLSESEGTAKEAEKEQGHCKAAYWLISLAALVSLLVGILCVMESATLQTAGAAQLGLAAGGVPSQGSTDTAFDCGDTVDDQLGIEMLATQLFRRQVREANVVKVVFD